MIITMKVKATATNDRIGFFIAPSNEPIRVLFLKRAISQKPFCDFIPVGVDPICHLLVGRFHGVTERSLNEDPKTAVTIRRKSLGRIWAPADSNLLPSACER